jgi:hypothetical protein
MGLTELLAQLTEQAIRCNSWRKRLEKEVSEWWKVLEARAMTSASQS